MARKSFYSKAVCHICGWNIPLNMVDPHHPLFGTIDHVIPKKLGGPNSAANRKPAHRWCNERKGHGQVTDELRRNCALRVRTLLGKHALPGQPLRSPKQNHLVLPLSPFQRAKCHLALWYAQQLGLPVLGNAIAADPAKPVGWRAFYRQHREAIWQLFEEDEVRIRTSESDLEWRRALALEDQRPNEQHHTMKGM